MKRMRVVIFMILLLVCYAGLEAAADESPSQGDVKKVLKSVSSSIVKVISERHRLFVASGVALSKNTVISHREIDSRRYNRLYIQTTDGKEYDAKVIGRDRRSPMVLLKIDKKVLKPLKHAKSSEVGDWISLIGTSYQQFPSIYRGNISSINFDHMLLDAPIAPGMSGAAVVNRKGELVGIVRGNFQFTRSHNYKYKTAEGEIIVESSRNRNRGLCYALPIDHISKISKDLQKFGRIRQAWLGVYMKSGKGYVTIKDTIPNSPAAQAGLRKGDTLIKIGKKPIKHINDVSYALSKLSPKQPVKIHLLRDHTNQSVLVVMGEAGVRKMKGRVSSPRRVKVDISATPEFQQGLPEVENFVYRFVGARSLGVDVVELTPELAKKFKVKEGTGLMVSKISRGTAAQKAGLKVADIIVKMDSVDIRKISDMRNVLNHLEKEDDVVISIYRKGNMKKMKVMPDRNKEVDTFFHRFNNKMKEFKYNIDAESGLLKKSEGRLIKQEKRSDKAKEEELRRYKITIEKMKQEQKLIKEQMIKMQKYIEKKEKEQQLEEQENKKKEKKKEKKK